MRALDDSKATREKTMDQEGFRRFLKRMGKKEHVVDGLIAQAGRFEEYLSRERQKGLDQAGEQDLLDYAAALHAQNPRGSADRVRGIALYYRFAGNQAMADLAAGMREKTIAKTRRAFSLQDFRGIDPDHAARLRQAGIVNVEQMLVAGRTPENRQRLAQETGVPLEVILELVKLSDLSRLGGLKGIRARLYYDAGIETPAALARWEPEALRQMLVEFVEQTGFDGIAPLPKEVRNGVATARGLPSVVQYDRTFWNRPQIEQALALVLDLAQPERELIEYRLVGTAAALLQEVQLPVGDLDILVKERAAVDAFATALAPMECLTPPAYLSDARQYFAEYQVYDVPVGISTVEWETDSDGIECLGTGPWEHYVSISVGEHPVPAVALELRLVSDLCRDRPDRFNPLIQHLRTHGCDVALLRRGMQARGIPEEVQQRVLDQLGVLGK